MWALTFYGVFMPSINVTLDRNWTLIETGLQAGINVQPTNKRCEIAATASTPAVNFKGITINPEDFRLIDLPAGENLYARSLGGTVTITVTT